MSLLVVLSSGASTAPHMDTVGTTRYFTLKCDVIQCSRKRTLSAYAFGDWVVQRHPLTHLLWYMQPTVLCSLRVYICIISISLSVKLQMWNFKETVKKLTTVSVCFWRLGCAAPLSLFIYYVYYPLSSSSPPFLSWVFSEYLSKPFAVCLRGSMQRKSPLLPPVDPPHGDH